MSYTFNPFTKKFDYYEDPLVEGDIDHDALTNTHNLTTDIDHASITNTHNLTTDIDHDQLTNVHQDVNTTATPTFAGVVVADGGTVGQAAGPLLTFDDTNNYLEIMGCDIGIGNSTPDVKLHLYNTISGGGTGNGDNIVNLDTFSGVNANASLLQFRKSSANVLGTQASVSAGDTLGKINFTGANAAGTPAQAFGAYIQCFIDANGAGAVTNDSRLAIVVYDHLNNAKGQLHIDGNLGHIGMGEEAEYPCTELEIANSGPVLTIHNTTHEDTADLRQGYISWRGEKGDTTEHALGQIGMVHDGSGDDFFGKFTVDVNDNRNAWWDKEVLSITTTKMIIGTGVDVGIGTTAPDKVLEINAATGGSLRLTYNDADGSATDYCDFQVGSDGDLTITTVDSDGTSGDITFSPDGDSVFLTGNVGMGIAAPTSVIHAATADNTIIRIRVENLSTGTAAAAFFEQTNDDGVKLDIGTYGSGHTGGALFGNARANHCFIFDDDASSSGLSIGTGTNNKLTLGTNFTAALTIDTSQNIGIGTDTPAGRVEMDVNNTATLTDITQAIVNAALHIESGDYSSGHYLPGIVWSTSGNNPTKPKGAIYMRETGAGTEMHFNVSSVYATGANVDMLSIIPTGVGIGTIAPTALLHIDQSNSSGAKPVVTVDQADVSEEFIRFIGTSADGVLTQSVVEEGDQAGQTLAGWLKIYVQDDGNQVADAAYHIPFYTLNA